MANGKDMKGTGVGNEYIYRVGLGDPRSGGEKLLGLANRVLQGHSGQPVRKIDDSPETMAKNRELGRKGRK